MNSAEADILLIAESTDPHLSDGDNTKCIGIDKFVRLREIIIGTKPVGHNQLL